MELNLRPLSRTIIDAGLHDIYTYLSQKYGTERAREDMEPLIWYINPGRASAPFLRECLMETATEKIAEALHKGGSYDAVIERVKKQFKQV